MSKLLSALMLCGLIICQSALALDRYEAELLLQKYDYIRSSWLEYGRNATEEEYTQAVRDLQFTANLTVTGLLDNATQQRLVEPRCGRSDDVSFPHKKTGLSQRNLTFGIFRYPWSSSVSDIRDVMAAAFAFWEKLTPLRFTELIGNSEELKMADITIVFDSGYHDDSRIFDDEGGIVAHARYPGEINELQIHFDSKEKWGFNLNGSEDDGSINLYRVAVHEIGHILGLRHSTNPHSVMFAWFGQGNALLPEDEQTTLNKLYPSGEIIEMTLNHSTVTTPKPALGLPCPKSVDAVLVVQRQTFFFSNDWFWSINANGIVTEQNTSIYAYWYGLPFNISKIDAVYYHKPQQKVVFFIGKKYYLFQSNRIHPSTPAGGRPIADFCLPNSVNKVDAVFFWEHNKMTYIISGNMYWRINDENYLQSCPTDSTYPRDMSVWRGVQLPVDAAFTSVTKELYFFKNGFYWMFNDTEMSVTQVQPKLISDWSKCLPLRTGVKRPISTTSPDVNSSPSLCICAVIVYFFTIVYILSYF
ncbi:matrix metalloproteinase-17-like [Watersipora subatra]|uniref:matrix metalloproteinase-17-like n=1 Tax=Watersipora subatra TaxID=2589382 RepID=UPI00355C2370